MEPIRRAVIDVGTNSVKLLVADVTGLEVRPLLEDSQQTRLGRGFYQTHHLQSEAIEATAKAVSRFAALARDRRAASIRVVATSAARDATNAGDLTSAIEQASGLKAEIISGDQEADLVFQGITTDPTLAAEPLLLLDVGGGSTEFILGRGTRKHFRASFPLGAVRLMERIPPGDPPTKEAFAACRSWLEEFLVKEVQPQVDEAMRREVTEAPEALGASAAAPQSVQLVGTGGTASILARMEAQITDYNRARIEATRLKRERVSWHVERLWSVPLEERKRIIGLPPNRADVILTGTAIYQAVMEHFKFDELRVSTRGLRFAAVMNHT